MIISKHVQIKPGVIRNVHVRENGKACWVVTYDGVLRAVSGKVVDGVFMPNPQWTHVIDAYIPRRISRKGEAVIKQFPTPPHTPERLAKQRAKSHTDRQSAKLLPPLYVLVDGVRRKVSRPSPTRGSVRLNNKTLYGRVNDGVFTLLPKHTNTITAI